MTRSWYSFRWGWVKPMQTKTKKKIIEVILLGIITLVFSYLGAIIAIHYANASFLGHDPQLYKIPVYELTLNLWIILTYMIHAKECVRLVIDKGFEKRGIE